jgi:RNA:NAD 2'-phosphotransferase (TPT1/KptA family)
MTGGMQVMRPDGFVSVPHVMRALQTKRCGVVTPAELEMAVNLNDKCRFQLLSRSDSDKSIVAVRATYAHSLSAVRDEYLYMPVPDGDLPRYLYHATFLENLDSIMEIGLIPGGIRNAGRPDPAERNDVGSKLPEWRSHVFFSPVPPGHTGFIDLGRCNCVVVVDAAYASQIGIEFRMAITGAVITKEDVPPSAISRAANGLTLRHGFLPIGSDPLDGVAFGWEPPDGEWT